MKNPDSIMAPSDKPKVIITQDSIFQNAKCLFIEYYDVMRAPWLVLTRHIAEHHILDDVLDMSETSGWQDGGWLEWYANRPYRNPLRCFPSECTGEALDDILDRMMDNTEIINHELTLTFYGVLYKLVTLSNVAEQIVVYTPTYHNAIQNEIYTNIGHGVEYVTGKIEEVLETIPTDTTYVFSDVNLITVLEKLGRIQFSSIILASGFAYNAHKDGTALIDFKSLFDKYIFRFSMFESLPKSL